MCVDDGSRGICFMFHGRSLALISWHDGRVVSSSNGCWHQPQPTILLLSIKTRSEICTRGKEELWLMFLHMTQLTLFQHINQAVFHHWSLFKWINEHLLVRIITFEAFSNLKTQVISDCGCLTSLGISQISKHFLLLTVFSVCVDQKVLHLVPCLYLDRLISL